MLEDLAEDVTPMKRPWRKDELRNLERSLPQLKEESLRMAAMSFKPPVGVGCDGFHSRVYQTFPKELVKRWWSLSRH